jgi:hypothetical protein
MSLIDRTRLGVRHTRTLFGTSCVCVRVRLNRLVCDSQGLAVRYFHRVAGMGAPQAILHFCIVDLSEDCRWTLYGMFSSKYQGTRALRKD